jgi:hypothetical protein
LGVLRRTQGDSLENGESYENTGKLQEDAVADLEKAIENNIRHSRLHSKMPVEHNDTIMIGCQSSHSGPVRVADLCAVIGTCPTLREGLPLSTGNPIQHTMSHC